MVPTIIKTANKIIDTNAPLSPMCLFYEPRIIKGDPCNKKIITLLKLFKLSKSNTLFLILSKKII